MDGEPGAEEIRDACKARLLRLLNTRERCVSELRSRLKADGYPSGIIEDLLSWALECNLVSDQRFAEAFISGKKNLGWGRLRIERELSSRGIEPYSLEGYPDSYFGDDEELARALDLALRVGPQKENRRQLVYKRLLARGFSSEIASKASSEPPAS